MGSKARLELRAFRAFKVRLEFKVLLVKLVMAFRERLDFKELLV